MSFQENMGFTYRQRMRMAREKRTSRLQGEVVEHFLPMFQHLLNTTHVYCALVRPKHSCDIVAFACASLEMKAG